LSPCRSGYRTDRTHESNTTTGYYALFNGCAGCVQSVFNACLLLLHFDLGGCTNLDHCNAAGQLGDALLQLLAIVIRGGVFDLDADFA
jgi:hypothetical protein